MDCWEEIERFQAMIDDSRTEEGDIPRQVQVDIMSDLKQRLRELPAELEPEKTMEYRNALGQVLAYVDEDTIFHQPGMNKPMMLYALSIKYGRDMHEIFSYLHADVQDLFFVSPDTGRKTVLRSLYVLNNNVMIDFISRVQGGFEIEGCLRMLSVDLIDRMSFEIEVIDRGPGIRATLFPTTRFSTKTAFDGQICPKIGFKVTIPWDGKSSQSCVATIGIEGASYSANLQYGKFCGLADGSEKSYWIVDDAILRNRLKANRSNILLIEKRTKASVKLYEGFFTESLKSLDPALREEVVSLRGHALAKIAKKRHGRTQRWLISDRVTRADDNGEAFFRYLQKSGDRHVDATFVISADSPDYEAMKQIGKVVPFGSYSHKQALIEADMFISSSADETVLEPFGDAAPYLKGLCTCKRVFLQHGVTKDDISNWIMRPNKNLWRIVACAHRERESFCKGNYQYPEETILLTGFPRHDRLLGDAAGTTPSRRIYLMPTWRKNLAGANVPGTDMPAANPQFEESSFYRFYQSFISDVRLDDLLREFDCEMSFVLHPSFMSEADKFTGTDRVTVATSCNYHEAFLDAACIVTDYSSVVFDFAMLKRPIAYIQFDKEDFFKAHTYTEGYFSYEEDGFGRVCNDAEGLLEELRTILERDFSLDDKYLKRIEEFFYWPDEPRCRLIERALLSSV